MKKIDQILAEHPVFRGLAKPHLALLAGCAGNVAFKENEFIFRAGREARKFHLIRRGEVALEIHVPGRGALRLLSLGEGDLLGWSWLFPPYQWFFDARALTRTVTTAMDAECVRNKCDDDHDFGYRLIMEFSRIIADRLHAAQMQVLDLYGEIPSRG